MKKEGLKDGAMSEVPFVRPFLNVNSSDESIPRRQLLSPPWADIPQWTARLGCTDTKKQRSV